MFRPSNVDLVGSLSKARRAHGSSSSQAAVTVNTGQGGMLAETPVSRRALATINPNAEKNRAATAIKQKGEKNRGKTGNNTARSRNTLSRRKFNTIALALAEYEKADDNAGSSHGGERAAVPNSFVVNDYVEDDAIEKSKQDAVQNTKRRARKWKTSALDLSFAEHSNTVETIG